MTIPYYVLWLWLMVSVCSGIKYKDKVAEEGEFPYHIQFAVNVPFGRYSYANGALVGEGRWVVTNAFSHLYGWSKMRPWSPPIWRTLGGVVDYNTHSSASFPNKLGKLQLICMHPQWNWPPENTNNIGLMRLAKKLEIPGVIKAVELNLHKSPYQMNSVNVTGFGRNQKEVQNGKLNVARAKIHDRLNCKDILAYSWYDDYICIGRFNRRGRVGWGDTGGPATAVDDDGKTYVVGLSNWQLMEDFKGGLDIFTNIYYHRNWLRETMALHADRETVNLTATTSLQQFKWASSGTGRWAPGEHFYVKCPSDAVNCTVMLKEVYVRFGDAFKNQFGNDLQWLGNYNQLYLSDDMDYINKADNLADTSGPRRYKSFIPVKEHDLFCIPLSDQEDIQLYQDKFQSLTDTLEGYIVSGQGDKPWSVQFYYQIYEDEDCSAEKYRCNQMNDCFDGDLQDELGCVYDSVNTPDGKPSPLAAGCYAGDFHCCPFVSTDTSENCDTTYCIRKEKLCDHVVDCVNGTDEVDCGWQLDHAHSTNLNSALAMGVFLYVVKLLF